MSQASYQQCPCPVCQERLNQGFPTLLRRRAIDEHLRIGRRTGKNDLRDSTLFRNLDDISKMIELRVASILPPKRLEFAPPPSMDSPLALPSSLNHQSGCNQGIIAYQTWIRDTREKLHAIKLLPEDKIGERKRKSLLDLLWQRRNMLHKSIQSIWEHQIHTCKRNFDDGMLTQFHFI